jgi:hypothetical protein
MALKGAQASGSRSATRTVCGWRGSCGRFVVRCGWSSARGSCAAEGMTGGQIAARVGCSLPTVVKWRGRYAQLGIEGLKGL